MSAWTEILDENEADARATMLSERCPKCDAVLADHYAGSEWKPCVETK